MSLSLNITGLESEFNSRSETYSGAFSLSTSPRSLTSIDTSISTASNEALRPICELKKPIESKSLLHVEKISIYDYPSAAKISCLWEKIAIEKAEKAKEPGEAEQFRACSNISSWIGDALTYPNSAYDIYVCKDEVGNYQGMMAIKVEIRQIYISYLVTNPINIRSPLNDTETKKVTGSGTSLLQKAEQIAIEEGKSTVALTPLESAIAFYKKNEFSGAGFYMRKTVQKVGNHITPLLAAA